MDTVVYIFSDFIPPVDSAIIARHAVKTYFDSQTPVNELGFMESINWTYVIPIIVLFLTPVGIYLRERYTRFKDALNVLEFVNFWNITLIARIDQMIYNLRYNIPIQNSLLNEDTLPIKHAKGVLVELDINRINELKVEKIMDLYINYRGFSLSKKQEIIHFANNQFTNYLILKGAVEQYKSFSRLESTVQGLDEAMIDFRHELFTFIRTNDGRLAGGNGLIQLLVDYEEAVKAKDKNVRKLDMEFINSSIDILQTQFTNMRALNGFNDFWKYTNKLHFKYSQFFTLAKQSFESETEFLNYLLKSRKDICLTQIKLLEKDIHWSWGTTAARYNEHRFEIFKMFQETLDSGIEKKKEEMEKSEQEQEKLKDELLK